MGPPLDPAASSPSSAPAASSSSARVASTAASSETSKSTRSTGPPPAGALAKSRSHYGCFATFTWVETKRWSGGLKARLDIGGDGINEGWLLRLGFNESYSARSLIGGAVISPPGATDLLILPRLASGYGTMVLELDHDGGGGAAAEAAEAARAVVLVDGSPGRAEVAYDVSTGAPAEVAPPPSMRGATPRIECVPDTRERSAEEDDEAWRRSARSDFDWMAAEFNRQYLNSHGKQHDEYQAASITGEKSLHFLNGRLWCFFGAVRNATRSLEEVVRMDADHVHSYLLLAKIRIGQGAHRLALAALDQAARVQPHHWQTHLMRLHCLRALGQLQTPTAEASHVAVCGALLEACLAAGHAAAYPLLCDGGVRGPTTRGRVPGARPRVRLLADEATIDEAATAKGKGKGKGAPPAVAAAGRAVAAVDEDDLAPELAGRTLYGRHLYSSAARRKLSEDRYVVLRRLLPKALLRVLQGWYAKLDERLETTAVYQHKTNRHEYLPEVAAPPPGPPPSPAC